MNTELKKTSKSGVLDPEFGENGIALLRSPDPNYPDYASYVVARGPDNKIYVAGKASEGLNNHINTLTCLNQDGSIDTQFAENGWFYACFTGNDRSYLLTENIIFVEGNILLTGKLFDFSNNDLNVDKAAVCFFVDGTINKNFGHDGVFTFHAPEENANKLATAAYNEKLLEIAQSKRAYFRKPGHYATSIPDTTLITDDRILLIHNSGSFDEIHSYIICITPKGQLDTTFNESGFARVNHDAYPFLELTGVISDDNGSYISAGVVKMNYLDAPDAIVLVKHSQD